MGATSMSRSEFEDNKGVDRRTNKAMTKGQTDKTHLPCTTQKTND